MHAVFSGHYDEELEKWDREREARLKGMGGDAGNDGKDGRDGGLGHGYGAGKTRLVWMDGVEDGEVASE